MIDTSMRSILMLLAGLLAALPCRAQDQDEAASGLSDDDRPVLASQYPLEELQKIILSRAEWRPYPTASDPAGLEQVPAQARSAYIEAGEDLLETEWPALPASLFLEYVRTGNRSNYQAHLFERRFRLGRLVLAEVFEREGRFVDQIVNGIWAICEESYWGVPAHLGLQDAGPGLPDVADPTVDLFAAEASALLAWTYYLLKPELDAVDPLISDRIEREVDRRILTPYLQTNDYWWMGFTWREGERERPVNNWNPWINSNVLATALIMENDPHRRLEIIHKILDSVDNFIQPYPADGGSDEGPNYWNRAGGSLFDTLDLLHSASEGAADVYDRQLIRRTGRFIFKMYIDHPYVVNFADAEAKASIDPALVYRYGKAIGDSTMMRYAAFAAEQERYDAASMPERHSSLPRALPALFVIDELESTQPVAPLERDVWLADLQVMSARSRAGTPEGFFLAAKGGHNDESHNHNDVGNFIVFHDGEPVLADAGRQTYTAQTFSSERYEIWNNQSAYHNVPSINGVMQQNGSSFAAQRVEYEASEDRALLQLDLAGAYPAEAQVDTWMRTITLNRQDGVEVVEEYQLQSYQAPSVLNFLTPLEVDVNQPGTLGLQAEGRAYVLTFEPDTFSAQVETITLDDPVLQEVWGDTLRRVQLVSTSEQLEGRIRVVLAADD